MFPPLPPGKLHTTRTTFFKTVPSFYSSFTFYFSRLRLKSSEKQAKKSVVALRDALQQKVPLWILRSNRNNLILKGDRFYSRVLTNYLTRVDIKNYTRRFYHWKKHIIPTLNIILPFTERKK